MSKEINIIKYNLACTIICLLYTIVFTFTKIIISLQSFKHRQSYIHSHTPMDTHVYMIVAYKTVLSFFNSIYINVFLTLELRE